jgi:cytochrome c
VAACKETQHVASALNADPENGRLLLRQFGCGRCHTIPGVAEAKGKFGPPLEAWA